MQVLEKRREEELSILRAEIESHKAEAAQNRAKAKEATIKVMMQSHDSCLSQALMLGAVFKPTSDEGDSGA